MSSWVREGALERLAPAFVRLPGDAADLQGGHLAHAYLEHHRPRDPLRITGAYALAAMVPEAAFPRRAQVLVDHGRRLRVRSAPFETVQHVGLNQVPVVRLHGLPFAWPPQSLADLAGGPVEDDDLIASLYLVINAVRCRATELVAAWSRMDHPGARRLLDLTARGVLEHESPAELALFRDVFASHPPLPDCQVQIAPQIRVDFAYLFAGLVIEYYGERAHAARVDEDGSRIYALRTLGLESIIVTKSVARDAAGLRHHIHTVRREREELMLRGLLARPHLPRQPDRLTPLRTLVPGG